MGEKKRGFVYVEPEDYFPKDILNKYLPGGYRRQKGFPRETGGRAECE